MSLAIHAAPPCHGHKRSRTHKCAFTLVELLVVIGVISLLISVLLPAMAKARQASARTQFLSNIRQLLMAQSIYAVQHDNLLVHAGDGTNTPASVQGSWIVTLETAMKGELVRRCPSDASPHFAQPLSGRLRLTSYGINNFVSPTHAPFGQRPVKRITQVKKSSSVVQFVELAETGTYATSDHIHVQDFQKPFLSSPDLINLQMPTGRHGGRKANWNAVLNYGFLDGHAETLRLSEVYTSSAVNRFNPAAAK